MSIPTIDSCACPWLEGQIGKLVRKVQQEKNYVLVVFLSGT